MTPLYWIAIGVAVTILTAPAAGALDLAEIFGTLLLVIGWFRLTRALEDLQLRLTLSYLALAALAVAVVLAFPVPREWLEDADPALLWASSLPALGFQAGLAHVMARRARAAGERTGVWWLVAAVAIGVAVVANVLYDAAGWRWLYGVGTVGLSGVMLFVVMAAVHGGRTWAGAPEPEPEPDPEPDTGVAAAADD
ncbi:hypothetical protein JK386_08695 [Nocardioides sp. zg-536]|uniref:Uncharacterized protein n=1 Tax=Nocardioides faecalis TaxID=2803858 RepID=A0A938Y661_9ACTN|nr:hypothetical protein [Nocardioides faecalis]MBM9459980.1 hypothetical protein [Nocardioides faecalis]MBS4753150.1 hypothetical protein [Nocardioides faecalis]QVI58797.1 hypothetical protein KG111_17900 [Nocardioides faecalis]